jgi:hypothetical protein
MTQLLPSTTFIRVDRRRRDDQSGDDERLRAIRVLLDAVVHRLDDLWFTSTDLRDGPRAVGTFEARQLLGRAATALDSGAS